MNADFHPGSRVGDYVLDAYVGGGGFGAVWRGHVDGSEEPVAIKLLTGALSSGDSVALRADIEVLAAAAASRSPHVVRVLGGGATPVPYIVMEFIAGHDLEFSLREQRCLSADKTVEVGLAIGDALRALHEVGIVHRDIKPANVMIDEGGAIKLADFGIAKIVGYASVTTPGQAPMTMAYAAPEIWDAGGKFGQPSYKSDLYSMGVLLYQCLAGAPPFSGNYAALYRAHVEQRPEIDLLPDDTPTALRILIRRCLEKRQEDRPQDAVECVVILNRALAELADKDGPPSPEPARFGTWIKDAPHPTEVWAWRCHHERSGAMATVEVHFSDDLDSGVRLSRLVETNHLAVPYGVERLIESSRLLLHPNERWLNPPGGQFEFWVAREDLASPEAANLSEADLRTVVAQLASLIEFANRAKLNLDLRGRNLSVREDRQIYLRRPGLSLSEQDAGTTALACLQGLPLASSALALLESITTFDELVEVAAQSVESASTMTQLVQPVADQNATVVAPLNQRQANGSQPSHARQELEPGALHQGRPSANRRPALIGVAALVLIAVVGLGILLSTGRKENDQPVVAASTPAVLAIPTVLAAGVAPAPTVASSITTLPQPPTVGPPTSIPPANYAGSWRISDTVTSGVGAGQTFSFNVVLNQTGSSLSGGNPTISITGTVQGGSVSAQYSQPALGYTGSFAWTMSPDGSVVGTFTSTTPNQGVSQLSRLP